MADLEEALLYCLDNEKGFSNNPLDRGGPTNRGITLQNYAKFKGKPVSIEELKNISDDEIKAFYYLFFWKPLRLESVCQDTATAIFDTAVNMGSHAAIECVQKALGLTAKSVDGVIGSATLDLLNKTDTRYFIINLISEIQDRYASIVEANPSQVEFIKGWLRRSRKLLTLSACN